MPVPKSCSFPFFSPLHYVRSFTYSTLLSRYITAMHHDAYADTMPLSEQLAFSLVLLQNIQSSWFFSSSFEVWFVNRVSRFLLVRKWLGSVEENGSREVLGDNTTSLMMNDVILPYL